MADAQHKARLGDERPLSPHLQVYRPQINMVMSIVHRITGAALYLGTIILAAWLFAAAAGRGAYDWVTGLMATPLGLLIMLGYTWALVHHAFGGIRHLIWDTGRGLGIPAVNALSWLSLIGSLAATAGIWYLVWLARGGLW